LNGLTKRSCIPSADFFNGSEKRFFHSAGIKDVTSFDFMDPPSSDSLNTALRQLSLLSAVQISGAGTRLTPLGQKMAGFPLEPRSGV
jgi:HrpA-like RNA helicase